MCDCYEDQCRANFCVKTIPIHIADGKYGREKVAVFCEEHLPSKNITVFTVKRISPIDKDEQLRVGQRFGVRLNGGRTEPWHKWVHPNIASFCLVEIFDRNGKLIEKIDERVDAQRNKRR